MAKRSITKTIKTIAFPSSGKELRIVPTYFLNVVLALTDLRGLITQSILNGFKFTLTATISTILNVKIKISYPAITIKKSITFQVSLK